MALELLHWGQGPSKSISPSRRLIWVKVKLSVDLVKSGQLTNIFDSVSTTNQQNLSTVKNVDLRKSHPHQQNWSIVQIVDSLLDPNQQSVSLKIGETTKCTLGFFLHNNKFVDQLSGSNVQIVVSGPTSTNCVIPNLPRGLRQLYQFDLLNFSPRRAVNGAFVLNKVKKVPPWGVPPSSLW